MKKIITLVLALAMCLSCFAGCGGEDSGENGNSNNSSSATAETEYTPVDKMATALLEIKSGTADAAVVDSVMAEAMVGEGTDYSDLMIVDGITLAEEEYAIGFRDGSTAVEPINEAIEALYADGTVAELAEKYNLSLSLIDEFKASEEEGVTPDTEADDWGEIQNKGTLVIGITEYAPMNYYDENGTLVGFDTEFAQAVCDYLGLEAEFIVINWGMKETELQSKNIDCLWNGMTVTEELMENIDFSGSYMYNKQVIVIDSANADNYTDIESFKGASFVAEQGSAGEGVVQQLIEDGTL